MKKLLSVLLAVLMLLSMATVAMADTTVAPATFKVKLETKGDGIPGREYTFNFTDTGVTAPAGYETAVATNQTKTVTTTGVDSYEVEFTTPAFVKPGNYLYKVTMTHDKIEGATDNHTELYVIMSVVNDTNGLKVSSITMYADGAKDNKIDRFETVYKTASLTINKTVNTEALDSAKGHAYKFEYTISGLNAGEKYAYTVAGTSSEETADTEGKISGMANLADAKSLVFTNLPVGATYTVKETDEYKDGQNGEFVGTWDKVDGTEVAPTNKTLAEAGAVHNMTNTFTYKNDLSITKKVTGDGGYLEETFPVKVTFEGEYLKEGASYGVVIVTKNGEDETTSDLPMFTVGDGTSYTYTFNIKNNQTVTIKDLPQNVKFKVEETDSKGHKPTYTNQKNTLTNADQSVTIENNNTISPETGVSLDTLPYVLVLALAGAGLVLMIARKRRVQD